MDNTNINLNSDEMDPVLTAIEFFLDSMEDEMDEDHPNFKTFTMLQDLQARISAKFRA
jgi:hypothetical protein